MPKSSYIETELRSELQREQLSSEADALRGREFENRRPLKMLEIVSYPPPRAGWGMRVQFLKRHLESLGHECRVLNTGISRKVPSPEYETVENGVDYIRKLLKFARAGYLFHVHANGKSPAGLALALAAEVVNLFGGRRCVLTFHAGEQQTYFPRGRAPLFFPLFWLLFAIPRAVICNSAGVKRLIQRYGIAHDKIFPIAAFTRQYLEFEAVELPSHVEQFYRQFANVVFCYINVQNSYHPDVLIDGFRQVALDRPDVGLLICGLMGHKDPAAWNDFTERIARYELAPRLCLVDDFDHDQFLTALTRATLCVRTPPADGVSSSVLEALALRIPVVAAENFTRPAGVMTYKATDPNALAAAMQRVLSSRSDLVKNLPDVAIPNTLPDEVNVLIGRPIQASE